MDVNARSLSSVPSVQRAGRRIRLNSIWLLLARLIAQAQLIVFTVIVARGLGVAGFGQYAFVAALIFVGNVATTFGTDTLLIREVARDRQAAGGLISATVWIQLLLSLAWLITVVIAADALSGQSPEVVLALKVYSLSLIPLAFFSVFTAILRAHERMDVYLLLNIFVAFVQLVGTWLVLQGQGSLLSLVLMLNGVQLSAAISAGVLCRHQLLTLQLPWNVTRSQLIGVARLAWPFALLSVLAVIYQRLGVLMLSTLALDAQAGWYAAATRITEPLKLLHFAVLGALLPALSHLAVPLDRQQRLLATSLFRRSLLFLLIFSLLAVSVIIVLAQPIVMLLFGATYAPTVEVVQLLAVSVLPYTISASLSLRLVTQGRERRVLGVTTLSVIVAFLLNRGLIAAAGSNGAAVAVIGGESFLALMMLVLRR